MSDRITQALHGQSLDPKTFLPLRKCFQARMGYVPTVIQQLDFTGRKEIGNA